MIKVTVIITTLLFLLPVAYCLSPVYAADSTPSADIKAKLEGLKKEIASKAAKLKLEVDKKLKDKVFIGKIKNISIDTLIVDTKNGPKTISMSQDTLFGSDTNLKYAKKLLEKDDYIAGLGDVDDTGALTAKKIVLLLTPNSKLKTYLWGQVISITDNLVTLKDRSSKNIAISIPDQSAVKVSDFVILTGKMGKRDVFEAEFVYVIPQSGIIKPKKKIATPSAKTATSSTKPASR